MSITTIEKPIIKPVLTFNSLSKLLAKELNKKLHIRTKPKRNSFSHRKKVELKRTTKLINEILEPSADKFEKFLVEKHTAFLIDGHVTLDEKEVKEALCL